MVSQKNSSLADRPEAVTIALKNLPSKPGVYEMINAEGGTLYVGKAKDLRKRVQTYFRQAADLSPRIRKMIEKTVDVSWTEVRSEVEALILEANLIKEKYPKFNVLMRDDKSYAYFCITMAEDFPRLFLTRKIVKDGSLYFGPKTSSSSIRQTIDLLQDIFRFRTTNLEITEISPGEVQVKNQGNIKYPCLNFHIGKCRAPCIGNISKKEYRAHIAQVVKFLRGDTAAVTKDLQAQMQKAALEKQFEKAARLRDLCRAIESVSEKQVISAPDEFSADVIGSTVKFDRSFFHLFQIRSGKIINSETFSLPQENAENPSEMLFAFLREHADRAADYPKILILSGEVFPESEQFIWEQFFETKWQQKVEICLPQKGKRRDLLKLAEQNATSYAIRNAGSFMKNQENIEKSLEALQQKLDLPKPPERIECFDISHLGGTETVASMVVFCGDAMKPADYRRFQLRTIEHGEIDDFKSMREVMTRRLRHIPRQLPEGYKVQKIISKKDLAQIRNILETEKIPFEEEKDTTYLALKKNDEMRGFLSVDLKNSNQEVRVIWTHQKDHEKELEYFLLRKLTEISNTKKIFAPALSFPPRIKVRGKLQRESTLGAETDSQISEEEKEMIEQLGFTLEENTWIYKNLGKKKTKDSLKMIPDVIMIDGGKGQLSAANQILQQFPFAEKICICSLAKRLEEVYIPGQSHPLAITKDSPEGKLLQQIRDEAHRFAITYHKKLHQKAQQKSVLDEIPGIGTKTKKKLLQTFGSVSGIQAASDEELEKVIGEKLILVLRKNL